MSTRARRESRPLAVAVALGLLSVPIRAGAQDADPRPRADSVDVRFPRGATSVTLRTQVSDGVDRDYVLRARRGQTLTVRLDDPRALAGVEVIAPDFEGAEEWTSLSREGWRDGVWSAQLPASGAYRVRLMGVAPRAAPVRVVVGITDPPPRRGTVSFAEGLTGRYELEGGGGTLDITRLADGRLWFGLDVRWSNGYAVHVGMAQGVVVLDGDVGTYTRDECRLTFRATPGGISVAHLESDADCAFGANVTVDGTYARAE